MLGVMVIRNEGFADKFDNEIDTLPLTTSSQNRELTQERVLDNLLDLASGYSKLSTLPDGSEKEEFHFFDLSSAYIQAKQRKMYEELIIKTPDVLDRMNQFLSQQYPGFNFETDYEDAKNILQELFYSVNNGKGPAEVLLGDSIEDLLKKVQGLTMYANTNVQEFLAEAHAMIESIESIKDVRVTGDGFKALKTTRAIYEDIMNPNGPKFNLGLDSETRREIEEALNRLDKIEKAMDTIPYQ